MRIASLGSGSRGNGTLIDDGHTCVLVDLGFTLKDTIRRLKRLGKQPEEIDAVLVTHEHADHINGVAMFARKFGSTVYVSHGTNAACRMGIVPSLEYVNCHSAFTIGSLGVEPVPVPHDAREPCQYIVSSNARKVGILTDLGYITPFVEQRYDGCDALLLECNHDTRMLIDGPYPLPLKERVGGIHGHLSNEQAAGLLAKIDVARLQHLIVCHISEKNNLPELACNAVAEPTAGWHGKLHVADQDSGFDWIHIE